MRLGRYRRELSVAAAFAGLLAVLAVAAPRFFRPEQVADGLEVATQPWWPGAERLESGPARGRFSRRRGGT